MKQFTIYCTPEQCEKALKLGAPITRVSHSLGEPFIPECTAEQMIGWLEEQNLRVTLHVNCFDKWCSRIYTSDVMLAFITSWFDTRQEATLAAIDAALDYLIKQKTNE